LSSSNSAQKSAEFEEEKKANKLSEEERDTAINTILRLNASKEKKANSIHSTQEKEADLLEKVLESSGKDNLIDEKILSGNLSH
jgi:hypothetical protein